MDILGLAIYDYYFGDANSIQVYINGEPDDPMHPAIFFRTKDEMIILEKLALGLAFGKILDVGAGAGCHSLVLQERFSTTALDISSLSCQIMQERGVRNIINEDVFSLKSNKYDTILLLMNGLGMCGTVEATKKLLLHLKTLLNPGGIIIGDSSDVKYFFEQESDWQSHQESGHYYGEVMFELEYKNQMTNPFPWLFIDPVKMQGIAVETGFEMEVLGRNDRHQYLAKFSLPEEKP